MADWGPRNSNPYLGVSRRLLIPYPAVLWYVCQWDKLPCNVPYPCLLAKDIEAIFEVYAHEHRCRTVRDLG